AQVVALAAAGVEAGERAARHGVGEHRLRHRVGDRFVVPGLEEAPARGDHLLAVAGVERTLVLHRQQVHVALRGDVEAVAVRATQATALALQWRAVERAGQRGEGADAHLAASAGLRNITSSILKGSSGLIACGTLAGISRVSPAARAWCSPPTTMSARPSTPMTSASNGAVCSLSPSPASKANSVTLPPVFFTSMRLTTALSWNCSICARFSTRGGASVRRFPV